MDVIFEFVDGREKTYYGISGFYRNGKKIEQLFEGNNALYLGKFTIIYNEGDGDTETIIDGDLLKTIKFLGS